MLFHEVLARQLDAHGIKTLFGVAGDGNLFVIDTFQRVLGGRYVAVAHEANAVLAARGYAQAIGGLGVATVSHGPALCNTVNALVEASRERVPLLVIAGDTPVADKHNLQKIDQREIVMSTGAGFEQVRSPESVSIDTATAIQRALTERRPIVLNVPIEFQWLESTFVATRSAHDWAPTDIAPSPSSIEGALGAIANARRPVVLAGRGSQSAEARAAVLRFAERIGAPVATTLRARELFHGEPHNLGIAGTLSHELATEVLSNSDCVIALGASLTRWTTLDGWLLSGRAVIQVDSDPLTLGKSGDVDFRVLGSVTGFTELATSMLDEAGVPPTTYATPELAERLAQRVDPPIIDRSGGGTVDIRVAVKMLEESFDSERNLVLDAGRFVRPSLRGLHVTHPSKYFHTLNFGSIGLGMGTAIGAAVGSNGPTLLVVGDGGFMLGGLNEFNTAVRYGLDIVVVVFNDGAYGAEHIQLRNRDLDPAVSTFDWPEFATVARALGGDGYTVRTIEELASTLEKLPERQRPVLIDIKLDPELQNDAA